MIGGNDCKNPGNIYTKRSLIAEKTKEIHEEECQPEEQNWLFQNYGDKNNKI